MTPSGTLNLRNSTYILEWDDLSSICIKVWFPLCTNSISLHVLQEFEAYSAVIKSLKRSLLLALPGKYFMYPESDSGFHGNRYLLFFSLLQLCKDCTCLSSSNSGENKWQICAYFGRAIKHKPLPLLFDNSNTKAINLYFSQVPDLWANHAKHHSLEQ